MKQIRHGVFETNSSSTHSLTMCLKADYELFKAGKLILDGDSLIALTPEIAKQLEDEGDYCWDYTTYDKYCDSEKESFYGEFTTPSGDVVVAFGEYGYDG